MSKIGFIGLGIMGHPMAKNLQDAGHKLFVLGSRKVPPDLAGRWRGHMRLSEGDRAAG